MENYLRYWDVFIILYLIGLSLSSMLYIPHRVAKHKTTGTSLTFTVLFCFLWPICFPVLMLWLALKCLLIVPLTIAMRFIVRGFRLDRYEFKRYLILHPKIIMRKIRSLNKLKSKK